MQDRHSRQPAKEAMIERAERQYDRDPVQPRQVAGQNERELKHDRDQTRDPGERLRQEVPERHNQLDEVVERDATMQDGSRKPMRIPTEWVRDRLGFEVVIEAGQIAPALVAADLDEPGAKHQSEQRPPIDPIQDQRRFSRGGTGKDREESQFEQQRFPSEAVEGLADVDERQIQNPQKGPDDGAGKRASVLNETGQGHEREQDANPSGDAKDDVGRTKVEQARRDAERDGFCESLNRKQAAFAKQGNELIDYCDERDQIDEREASLEDESRMPIGSQVVRHARHGVIAKTWPQQTQLS